MLLAHGIGSRADLPIPVWLAAYGAGFAVLISFAALRILWPSPRLKGLAGGRPLPAWLARPLGSATTRGVVRAVVLLLSLFIVVAGFLGPRDASGNLALYALYVVLWVGLVPVSLLLGPVWRYANPLRTIHRLVARASGTDPAVGLRVLPASLGWWPGAAALAAFVWLELVPDQRTDPLVVSCWLAGYGVGQLVLAQVYGEEWFAAGDGFEVYSRLIGSLSPLGRRNDGVLVVRNPLDGLSALPMPPGLVAVIAVLLGSTAFDGVTRTRWWLSVSPVSPWLASALLAQLVAIVAITFVLATRASAESPDGADALPRAFVHSVVPIAIGYAIAHYFSLLVLEGQAVLSIASDPLGTGANWFGSATRPVDFELVSSGTISAVQVGAIVVGHVVGVIAAHDRAVRLLPGHRAIRGQLPLLAVMVGYTVGGVLLLLGA